MRSYRINKGVLKPLEFLGLRAQYIVLLFVGFLCSFLIYFVLSFINSYAALACSIIGVVFSAVLAFYLNSKYGRYGLVFSIAEKNCCKHIRNDKRTYRLLSKNK